MNLKSNLERAAGELMAAGVPEPDLDAWYLLEYVTGVSRAAYFADPDRELTEAQQEAFDACVKKRVGRIPLQHITGTQEFMGLSFRVNEHVLIPRQDTEILVEEALEMLKKRAVPTENRDGQTTEILDLCTGSGCILLSVLHYAGQKEHMNLRGTGSDLSGQALETARENAEHLGIRAHFVQSDLFGSLPGRYAMILSNPPYIRSGDLEELQPEVRLHDPGMALDGGADGLAFYRRITEESPAHLEDNGILMFEIGCDQAADVSELMRMNGFTDITVKKDLAGLDRVVYGRYSK